MRYRAERKIRKRLRSIRHHDQALVSAVQDYERSGISLTSALRRVMLNSDFDWNIRGTAAQVLGLADSSEVAAGLINRFFSQTEQTELWETALTIESIADRSVVPRLVDALHDSNLYRRHAAAESGRKEP